MTSTQLSPRARALCAALREAREASGFGVRELGRLLSIRHTDISLWETGRRVPSVETVAMILGALHVSPEARERILELAREASKPHWLSVGVNGISQQLAACVESERAAFAITEWAPSSIPGLLQTPDYARAMMRADDQRSQDDVELMTMVRTGRSEVLTRSDPVSFDALIGEAALLDSIGSEEIKVNQLRHLLDMARRPNITIGVVPMSIGWHPGLAGQFVLYEFADATPAVYFEHYSSGAFVTASHDVSMYQKAIDKLRSISKDLAGSTELMRKLAQERRGTT
jgi:transcriptional regulator with XRE-family HTH domain